MWLKKLPGIAVIVIGFGFLGHWADRTFFHPTSEDRQFWNKVADYGGTPATMGNPPSSVYFMLAVGSFAFGSYLIREA